MKPVTQHWTDRRIKQRTCNSSLLLYMIKLVFDPDIFPYEYIYKRVEIEGGVWWIRICVCVYVYNLINF